MPILSLTSGFHFHLSHTENNTGLHILRYRFVM